MPWKECHVEDERMRFVIRLKDGEKMAALCKEFGISRKTGYKIFARFENQGLEGLTDRSRRPYRQAQQLPEALEAEIVRLKREYPHWGAPRSVSGYGDASPTCCAVLPSARSMPSWIGAGWSSGGAAVAIARRARRCRDRCNRTNCGARTSRVNFSSAIGAIAFRSPSPISPAGI
jgi:hypothetical protein